MVKKAKSFFLQAILPELIGKLYSRPIYSDSGKSTSNVQLDNSTISSTSQILNYSKSAMNTINVINQQDDTDLVICFCQTIYKPEVDNVIGCDGKNCQYKWFHFDCLKIKKVPKGKWYCSKCKQARKRSK